MATTKSSSARFSARQRASSRATLHAYDVERGDGDDASGKYDKRRRGGGLINEQFGRIVDIARAQTRSTARNVALVLFALFLLFRRPLGSSSDGATTTRASSRGRAAAPTPNDVRRLNGGSGRAPSAGVKLIPRVIHQTYKSRASLTDRHRAMMKTWEDLNPEWETRFYDDEACDAFVREHFPDYHAAYASLTKKVEQSDFFRYLVVLKHGGVYADVDTECRRPMDDVIGKEDSLVVGWENEFDTDAKAYSRHFVRRRQVLNWVFAGAPGHPVLISVAKHITEGARRVFTEASNRNTLERTGPGAFTDAVMAHFESTQTKRSFWNVRVLPKVVLGTHPLNEEGVRQDHPDVAVAHRYAGNWKRKTGWNGRRSLFDHIGIFVHSLMNDLPEYRERAAKRDPYFRMPAVDDTRKYPVSALWEPAFDVMTPLVGTMPNGLEIEERDMEGYWLTLYGRPRVGTVRAMRPGQTPADIALAGPTRRAAAAKSGDGDGDGARVFIDIGADLGYYTLAAASRGDTVYAYEWHETFLDNLRASIAYNEYGDRIQVSKDIANLTHGARFDEFARLPKIDALRLAGRGWDLEIFKGIRKMLDAGTRPRVILFEMRASLIRLLMRHKNADIVRLFEELWNEGYTDIGHIGPACDGRGVRAIKSSSRASEFDDTEWCRMDASSAKAVVSALGERDTEVVVFFHEHA